jgi:hypothetical protein
MLGDRVLVRAIGGLPVELVAVEVKGGLVYVAHPGSLARVRAGISWPVGFPAEDVFEFDEGAHAALSDQWAVNRRLDRDDWRPFHLTLYSPRRRQSEADGLSARH